MVLRFKIRKRLFREIYRSKWEKCGHKYNVQYSTYTAHKKFMNTSTGAESLASFILEDRYLKNQKA